MLGLSLIIYHNISQLSIVSFFLSEKEQHIVEAYFKLVYDNSTKIFKHLIIQIRNSKK